MNEHRHMQAEVGGELPSCFHNSVAWVWLRSLSRTSPTLSTCHTQTSSKSGKHTCLEDKADKLNVDYVEKEKDKEKEREVTDSALASLLNTPCEWYAHRAEQ